MFKNTSIDDRIAAAKNVPDDHALPTIRIPDIIDLAQGLCPAGRFIHMRNDDFMPCEPIDLSVPPSAERLHRRFSEYLLDRTNALGQVPMPAKYANGFDFVRFLRHGIGAETMDEVMKIIADIDAGTRSVPLRVSHEVAYALRCIDVGVRPIYEPMSASFKKSLMSRLSKFTGDDRLVDEDELPEYGTGTACLATAYARIGAMAPAVRLAHCVTLKSPENDPRTDFINCAMLLGAPSPERFLSTFKEYDLDALLCDMRLQPFLQTAREVVMLRWHIHEELRPQMRDVAEVLLSVIGTLFKTPKRA